MPRASTSTWRPSNRLPGRLWSISWLSGGRLPEQAIRFLEQIVLSEKEPPALRARC